MKVANSILELIGKTPIVRINKLSPNPNVEIFAKLERVNPSGSVKDRIALRMIEKTEREGKLTRDKIIIEPTSGNTGIALAMVAAIKGYKMVAVMPENMSLERRKILKAYGAELILTPGKGGHGGAILKARELAKDEKYFMPDQFSNEENVFAHYETGKEILEQLPDLDYFIAGTGTSGTLMGVSKVLKEHNPKTKVIVVMPEKNHKIEGLQNLENSIVPEIYDERRIDEKVIVKDEDAFRVGRDLAKKEGIFAGISSGAVMFTALQLAKKIRKGKILVIFADDGMKYLSTELVKDL